MGKYKLNKLTIISLFERIIHKEKYIFDDSKILEYQKISKGDFKYNIIMLDKENNSMLFRVFVNIRVRKRIITYQLLKDFNNLSETNNYFSYLLSFITKHDNASILNKCYKY